ncbi:MAG TPA: sialidase family protein [Bryobacterales bacterium]|nr:sialidase family protein [Bryobacterales bacterium]
MNRRGFFQVVLPGALWGMAFPPGVFAGQEPRVIRHVTVYQKTGRYGGWPANHGIWSWNNEILAGFSAAYFQWLGPDRHPYDRTRGEEPYLARSLDGGETWSIEPAPELTPPAGMYTGPGRGGQAAGLAEPIDFTRPGFCMTLRMTEGQQGRSWFFYSYDRGKSWKGPFHFPMLGQTAIMARTDYIVNGQRDAMVFLTAAKAAGREGRPLVARTRDGGLSWEFVSWIAPDPGEGFSIMPSSVRLSKTEIVTAVRHEDSLRHGPNWIDAYVSSDDAKSWRFLSRPAPDTGGKSGNPPSLIRLRDGRLAITYGHRSPPFEIRARLSADDGKTWGNEIVLRSGGGAWDIGYTRTAQRADGKIVTAYYWATDPKKERTIEATIWDPGNGKR